MENGPGKYNCILYFAWCLLDCASYLQCIVPCRTVLHYIAFYCILTGDGNKGTQRGQQNPQWVVCMFSPADAHIVVCDPERLPGPEAVVGPVDCTRMIVKALWEGEHHALLLQVRLKDNARAARPGVCYVVLLRSKSGGNLVNDELPDMPWRPHRIACPCN